MNRQVGSNVENRCQKSWTYKERDRHSPQSSAAAGQVAPARRALYSIDPAGNRWEIDTSTMSERSYQALLATFQETGSLGGDTGRSGK